MTQWYQSSNTFPLKYSNGKNHGLDELVQVKLAIKSDYTIHKSSLVSSSQLTWSQHFRLFFCILINVRSGAEIGLLSLWIRIPHAVYVISRHSVCTHVPHREGSSLGGLPFLISDIIPLCHWFDVGPKTDVVSGLTKFLAELVIDPVAPSSKSSLLAIH